MALRGPIAIPRSPWPRPETEGSAWSPWPPFGPPDPLVVAHVMILCVTLNPCLDKTLTVPDWRPGDNVRGHSLREVVGGKGNNVARALGRLGRSARPSTFLGGAVGARCELLLRSQDGFDPLIIPTEAPTREILTVRPPEGPATAFFDPDPAVTPDEAEALLRAVELALAEGGVEALTLSGSSPSPSTHGHYGELIAMARARKVPAFLDTYGPSLEAIGGSWPEAIQLNRREAGLFLRRSNPTDADLGRMLDDWAGRGVHLAVVTDGPGAVLARIQGETYRATPPKVVPVNPIGSGDCLLAGLVDAHLLGLGPEATLRRGVAAAVANALVWDAGAIDPEEVRRLEASVVSEASTSG
jgi:tagatose 6-phosphate kinase